MTITPVAARHVAKHMVGLQNTRFVHVCVSVYLCVWVCVSVGSVCSACICKQPTRYVYEWFEYIWERTEEQKDCIYMGKKNNNSTLNLCIYTYFRACWEIYFYNTIQFVHNAYHLTPSLNCCLFAVVFHQPAIHDSHHMCVNNSAVGLCDGQKLPEYSILTARWGTDVLKTSGRNPARPVKHASQHWKCGAVWLAIPVNNSPTSLWFEGFFTCQIEHQQHRHQSLGSIIALVQFTIYDFTYTHT